MYRRFTQSQTPRPLKALLMTLAVTHIAFALIHFFLLKNFSWPLLPELLSVTSYGTHHGFLWQWLTFPFISGEIGLSLSFLIRLFFECYLLWMIGAFVIERIGARAFYAFLASCAIGTGLIASFVFLSTQTLYVLQGFTPLLTGLITTWAMFYGEGVVLLFFIIPLRIRTLLFVYLGYLSLTHLSHENMIGLFLDLIPAFITYFYALFIWKQPSPIPALRSFENKVMNLGESLRKAFSSKDDFAKRYDFKTGKAVYTDEEFIDAMLDKISKQGKDSLSFIEKWKLVRASRRMRRKNG